jgi:aspartate aminotransferase/aromatic-amino-acid transaminase
MFERIPAASPDPIFGLSEAFRADSRPGKINLGIGVYRDDQGRTPVLTAVKKAESRILEEQTSMSYLAIEGTEAYGHAVQELLLGETSDVLAAHRVLTAHTPGGTGALRVAADLLHDQCPETTVWMPDPTWVNHHQVFGAAGLGIRTYPYFDHQSHSVDFAAMLAAIGEIAHGDVVLLHGCCHNPTGADLTPDQWRALASQLAAQGLLPLVDIAYQGFAVGLEADVEGLRALCSTVPEAIICSSFSKNFALYNERVGALTILAGTPDTVEALTSQVKLRIRSTYSNPPAHGGAIVTTILGDGTLRKEWEEELGRMRQRIHDMRRSFVSGLDALGVSLSSEGNDFLRHQYGMFSFSGLTQQQVAELRDDHAIYVVGSGRVNFAAMTPDNVPRICDAIAAVL